MSLLSERIVKTATTYLGPASKGFLERQTASDVNGLNFDDIERNHLPKLARWVNIPAGLLIDKGKAKELAHKIAAL